MMNMNNVDERYVEAVRILNEKEGYEATFAESNKCNGARTGIMIKKEGSNIAPVFCLQPIEEQVSAEELAENLLAAAEKECKKYSKGGLMDNLNSLFTSFEAVEKLIFPCVCKMAGNEEYLKDVVYDTFLDLAVFYAVRIKVTDGTARLNITEEHLNIWGVDKERIRRTAEQNESSQQLFTYGNMLGELLLSGCGGKVFSVDDVCPEGLYMVSYPDKMNGGSLILRTQLFHDIAERTECDVLIIPSSVHEIMVRPIADMTYGDICYFNEMVNDVNNTAFDGSREEILSDHAYVFNRAEGRILTQQEIREKYR